jgi:serine 3-dehydrogenase
MSRIAGQLALITGASAGIGEACARRLARSGVHLILWARRADRLEALAAEIESEHGVEVETAVVDVREREQVFGESERLVAAGRVPDILLNNAGLAAGLSPIQEGDLEDWDRMLDTNVKGVLFVTRAFLPAMIERDRGHVLNIGSIAGYQVYPKGNVYNASKFAVRAITEGTNLDLLGTAIRVSSVDPGLVQTEFSVVRFAGDEERADSVYEGYTPLSGEDVADVVAFVLEAPPHVNVADVLLLPTDQRSAHLVHKRL